MTQISKKFLAKQLEDEVYETFWKAIAKLSKKEEVSLEDSAVVFRNSAANKVFGYQQVDVLFFSIEKIHT